MSVPTKEQIDAAIKQECDWIGHLDGKAKEHCAMSLFALRALRLLVDEPSEEMWDGLARAVVMGRDMRCLTRDKMREHLENSGQDYTPLADELSGDKHMAKGDVVVCIFKAMRDKLLEKAGTE